MMMWRSNEEDHDAELDVASSIVEKYGEKKKVICFNSIIQKKPILQKRCEAFGLSPVKYRPAPSPDPTCHILTNTTPGRAGGATRCGSCWASRTLPYRAPRPSTPPSLRQPTLAPLGSHSRCSPHHWRCSGQQPRPRLEARLQPSLITSWAHASRSKTTLAVSYLPLGHPTQQQQQRPSISIAGLLACLLACLVVWHCWVSCGEERSFVVGLRVMVNGHKRLHLL